MGSHSGTAEEFEKINEYEIDPSFIILKYSYNHFISSLLPFENLYYVLYSLRANNQAKML
jgi:hypothetical protein